MKNIKNIKKNTS